MQVNEDALCQYFGRYGPIASVKIMWPRSAEEMASGRHTGFVSFMQRRDAAQALRDLDGMTFQGHALRVGWGKALATVPAVPLYVHPSLRDKKEYKHMGTCAHMVLGKTCMDRRRFMVFKCVYLIAVSKGAGATKGRVVEVPEDMAKVHLIHRVIQRVIEHGPALEVCVNG